MVFGGDGATTMLLVCRARSAASEERELPVTPGACCSQITPWASIVPSACVGKYQSAGATTPSPKGIASVELPTCTPLTPFDVPGRLGDWLTRIVAAAGTEGALAAVIPTDCGGAIAGTNPVAPCPRSDIVNAPPANAPAIRLTLPWAFTHTSTGTGLPSRPMLGAPCRSASGIMPANVESPTKA